MCNKTMAFRQGILNVSEAMQTGVVFYWSSCDVGGTSRCGPDVYMDNHAVHCVVGASTAHASQLLITAEFSRSVPAGVVFGLFQKQVTNALVSMFVWLLVGVHRQHHNSSKQLQLTCTCCLCMHHKASSCACSSTTFYVDPTFLYVTGSS
jgi:predicted anti-sigma-YlaC factor YlaD